MNDIETARQAIRDAQHRDRPVGMPLKDGLLYQPVPFAGFEDLGCERNSSEHRVQMLADWLGRDERARVLDLGCANGFFLFRLRQLGIATRGLGIDYFAGNVETCRILADLHGLSELDFRAETVSPDLVATLTATSEFDVALFLSVHHHIVRTQSISAGRDILRTLYENVGTVIVEQGSINRDEYREWTGRDEPFSTRAYSRLISLGNAAGIPEEHAFCIGMGRYLSGQRDDMAGAGRVIVGFSKKKDRPRRVERIARKQHKNDVNMELLELSDGQVWKNVVCAEVHFAEREARALQLLEDAPGFVRLGPTDQWEIAGGKLRLERRQLRPIAEPDAVAHNVRGQAVARLLAMAAAGVVHAELHPDHLLLDQNDQLVVLDFETARLPGETPQDWNAAVAERNPAIGLGSYPRDALKERPDELDLLAMDYVFESWGVLPLTESERQDYLAALNRSNNGR